MERVHYRRHTPSRLHNHKPVLDRGAYHVQHNPTPVQPASHESGGFREKLIVQGIISGLIFAVVLALGMMDNPQAASIRINLNQAISDHITAEQVATEVHRFLGNTPLEMLAGESISIETPIHAGDIVYPYLDTDTAPVFEAETQTEGPITTPRIDEDMLREIFGWPEGDDLQTTAPEPIILPEL